MAVRIKATKDITRLTEERNAAVQEYTLIMSERDTVHKEIEKLQEELSNWSKKMKTAEAQKKATLEEVCYIVLIYCRNLFPLPLLY